MPVAVARAPAALCSAAVVLFMPFFVLFIAESVAVTTAVVVVVTVVFVVVVFFLLDVDSGTTEHLRYFEGARLDLKKNTYRCAAYQILLPLSSSQSNVQWPSLTSRSRYQKSSGRNASMRRSRATTNPRVGNWQGP